MKTLTLLLFLTFFSLANANTYYFSTNSGDDSRTPEEAQNPATPWKTLRKLNLFFSSLQPGDAVLLKRGETFYGTIVINKSGTPASPIVIGDYGSGKKPVITSFVTLSDWVNKGKGVWESYNEALASRVNMVVLDGDVLEMGRYPNSGSNGSKGYLTFESHVDKSSITDDDLSTNADLTGAELVLRSRRWTLDRNLITDHSGKKISYKASSIYEPYDNYGYFIQNDIRTLDKFGEWYYNPLTNKLSVYFGDNSPSSYNLQATTFDNMVVSQKCSNVLINNLSITGANSNGFNIRYGSNIVIKDCDILYSGVTGVKVISHSNFKIEGCTISYSNSNGIDLGYSGDNAIVRNNKIVNTGTIPGSIGSGDGKGLGIYTNGNGNLIEYNEIVNTGFMAINFNGDDVTVKNNFINYFCTQKDDGAGIYSHIGNKIPRTNRKIIGNIMLNGIGAGEGTSNPLYLPAEGIYLDNNASNIEITGNTVANGNNNGIYIHNAYGININNNVVYNNIRQLNVIEDPDNSRVRDCRISSNLFFSKLANQVVSNIKASADDVSLFGKFKSNYYARPLNDRLSIFNSYVNSEGRRINQNLELQGWKDKYGQDKDAKLTAKQIAPYKVNDVIGSDKIDNGTFNNDVDGVKENGCKTSWGNSGLLSGGYLQVVPEERGSSVSINIGGIKENKNYILKYSVRGSVDSSMTIGAYLRQDGSGYQWLTPVQYRKVSVNRSDNEMLFTSSSTEKAVTVVFKVDDENKYYLDNIQLYEVDATITNPDDSIRFEYNATDVDKTISLSGNYIDSKGKKYSNSVTLSPYSSIILLKNNNNSEETPVENEAPVVSITSPSNGNHFSKATTINISATASDDGSISKVEFYNGNTLLAIENSHPYNYSWEDVPAGAYSITAKATDNEGLETVSDAVEITVGSSSETAPVVSLLSPENNTSYSGPATIKINAEASDNNGTISKVEFYNGSTLLHAETNAPYTYTWANVPNGTYSITAKATDNDGLETTSEAVKISVGTIEDAPVVSITSPNSDDNFTGPASIRLTAKAKDKDGWIDKVEFYSGSTLLHAEYEEPYTYTWNDVPEGNYDIMAVTTDNDGNVSISDVVNIIVTVQGKSIVSSRPISGNENTSPALLDNKSLNVKLSPNPASNVLNILANGFTQNEKLTVSILSASGSVIKIIKSSISASQIIRVDVSSLKSGVYVVKVAAGSKVLSKEFIKL